MLTTLFNGLYPDEPLGEEGLKKVKSGGSIKGLRSLFSFDFQVK